MARANDWKGEMRDAMRREGWALHGPNRIIKVTKLDPGQPPADKLRGYVTLEKYIVGLTPAQMEIALGLPQGWFNKGCRVYRLTRLPATNQVDYELTAAHPDGLAFVQADADEEDAQRRLNPSRPYKPIYGVGSASIHQWSLNVEIPVAHVVDLVPSARYAYRHT